MVIVLFFITHWLSAVFCQTFFLHRYGAHKMFTMSLGWERFFHLLTYVTQGASYLNPRSYAILHRMHHAYSDTKKDPHSPVQHSNVFTMMWATKKIYSGLVLKTRKSEARFQGDYPEWDALDRFALTKVSSLCWVAFYAAFYFAFATAWWQWIFFPMQCLMGPIHGAIVNWCGHKYGYRNFDVDDHSKNTLMFDFLTLGELFQNNHHRLGTRVNFAARWFEVDPTYAVIKLFSFLGIIKLAEPPRAGTVQVLVPAAIKEAKSDAAAI